MPSRGVVVSLAGKPVTAIQGQGGTVQLQGVTLTPGGSATVINGQTVSAATDGLVQGASGGHLTTHAFSAVPTDANTLAGVQMTEVSVAIFTAGGKTTTAMQNPDSANPSASVMGFGSFSLTVGGAPTTISGEVISAAANGLVIDSTTSAFSSVSVLEGSTPASEAIINLGSSVAIVTMESWGTAAHDSVLEFGGQKITMDGSTLARESGILSTGSRGIVVVDWSTTQTAPFSADLSGVDPPQAEPTLGSSTITAIEQCAPGGSSVVVLDSKTLTLDGAPITTDGETMRLESQGLVINSGTKTSTASFSEASAGAPTIVSSHSNTGTGMQQATESSPSTVAASNSMSGISTGTKMSALLVLATLFCVILVQR